MPCAEFIASPAVWAQLVYARFALLRAGPAGGKEEALFYVVTARLKPCPDTCMVDGCGAAVQSDAGRGGVVIEKSRIGSGLCALRFAAREPCGQRGMGVILRRYGTAEAVP
ncbi:MAG: hypothetical protein ACRD72_06650 [Candidatus Angelobacter sp.]